MRSADAHRDVYKRQGKVGELKTHLILAGIGMGQPSQMTGEVLRAIRESDALIGAGRMLESAERALQNDLLIKMCIRDS